MRKLCITLASITTACASKANANSCSTIIEPHDWNFTYAAAAAGLIFLVLAIAKNIQFRRLPAADRHPRPPHPSILFCLAFIFFAKPVYDIVDSNINCCMPIGPGETERYGSFGDCGCKHRCMPPRVKLGASQLLLLKEANAGNAEAARQIAQYYLDNSYLPADDKIAYEWFEKSARLGNQAAQQRMAYPPYSNLETAVTTPWK